MKVVVAIDSFKGSATSAELNQAVKLRFYLHFPKSRLRRLKLLMGAKGVCPLFNLV